jgi:hypothetical protein
MWNAIRELISTLPLAFRDAYDKYNKDYGVGDPIARWETCCTLTNRAFEYATTLLYVNEYVSEEAMETVRIKDNNNMCLLETRVLFERI